jgi:integrase
MAKTLARLSALKVNSLKARGMHADGGGLYLQITDTGAKSWIYRFTLNGRLRDMGLGSATDISLADARTRAAECRRLRSHGIDPIESRKQTREQATLDAAHSISFRECAEAFIASHEASWRNDKHKAQWGSSLKMYAYPPFGRISVQTIDTALVMKALQPIWGTKTSTAARVRGRIERVLDWASARGYRKGDNPARWRGHLENLLPVPTKIAKVKHHNALPFANMPDFVKKLRSQPGVAALGLEFLILTGTRTSESLLAQWDEIHEATAIWTIPGSRMKAGKDHRVPLSKAALALLARARPLSKGDYVFESARRSCPMSNMAFLALLHRMDRFDITTHGFRSTFRDWVSECTSHTGEVAEMALAHVVDNKVEAAYRRGDLFEKRKKLMEDWARFCDGRYESANVLPIQRPRRA